MFNRWRNKLKGVFSSDREESHDVEDSEDSQAFLEKTPEIHTKMTYQYSERKQFRFPVIPDRPARENEFDTFDKPTYMRKKEARVKETKRTARKKTPTAHKKTVKQEEATRAPFKPTQFASPIYGYQERKQKREIEQIPTFIRNKERDHTANKIDNDEELNQQPEILEAPISNELESPVVEMDLVEEKLVVLEEEPGLEEIPASPEESLAIEDKEDNIEQVQEEEVNVIKDVRPQHQKVEKNPNVKPLPFNVVMTPKDKQQLEMRKRQQKSESAKKPETPSDFSFPFYLLDDPVQTSNEDRLWVKQQQELLEQTLKHFNVRARVVKATQGPAVTRFEVQPELGVKVSKVRNLSDDIKLNMSAKDIRIEAPIPGKNAIGIEVPNMKSQMVGLQEIFETEAFQKSSSPLTVGLGLSVEGTPVITDIAKMPHGLIAGATGSGKSVCINTILISLLYKANHQDVKFLLIDPKMVELAAYNGLPHLISPVITDVKAATSALKWAVMEMEERYEKFVKESVRDIKRYNSKMMEQDRTGEKMPFIVIVIDELADLMMAAPQDVEDAICRIAQKARACGIHLLLATQRPSVDVITGLIKANVPSRIAFSVSSQVDSRTIIDTNGAERLLGRGDMLFIENGSNKSIRIQGAYVSDDEIERVTNFARKIAPPNYLFEQEQLLLQMEMDIEEDELLEEVIHFVVNQNHASTSLLQRQFRIGYNRAARLIDALETRGIISGQNGSKPREVLLTRTQVEELLQANNTLGTR